MQDQSRVSRFELTRREVTGGLAALMGAAALSPALVPLPALASVSPMPNIADFLSATSYLTGVDVGSIDQGVAEPLWWQAVQQVAAAKLKPTDLADVVTAALQCKDDEKKLTDALTTGGLWPAATILQQLWYTGMVLPAGGAVSGQTPVLFYDQALAWAACSFTKPAASCGGEMGYWANQPIGRESK